MSPDEAEDGAEYSLVMPFVTVSSRGGPHDDVSYVAGFEAASINARLEMAASIGVAGTQWMPLHRSNAPQIDLIAMRYGFTVHREDFEPGAGDNYTQVRFERTLTPGDAT